MKALSEPTNRVYACPECQSLSELSGNVYLMGDDGVVVKCPNCDISQTFQPREEYEREVHSVIRMYGHTAKMDSFLTDCIDCNLSDPFPNETPLWKRNMYRFAMMKKHDCGEVPHKSPRDVSILKRIANKITIGPVN